MDEVWVKRDYLWVKVSEKFEQPKQIESRSLNYYIASNSSILNKGAGIFMSHVVSSRGARTLLLCLFFVIMILVSSAAHIQHHLENIHPQQGHTQRKRMLQSSLLGFDLSRISSGSFGGGFLQQNLINSSSAQSLPTPAPQPVRVPAPVPQPQTQSNEPISDKRVTNTVFRNVILYHQIPRKFLLNETYTFKGRVTDPTATRINVLLSLVIDGSLRISGSQTLNNKMQFQIPVNMTYPGKFYLIVSPYLNGEASRTEYEILERDEYREYSVDPPAMIDDLSIFERDNKIYVKWSNSDGAVYPLVKLTFEQYSTLQKVELVFSNFMNEVLIPLKNFVNFDRTTMSLAACQAKSSNSSAPFRVSEYSVPKMIFFDAEQHAFSQNRTDLAVFDNLAYIFSPEQRTVTITGRALAKLKNQMVVLAPSQTFKTSLINGASGQQGDVPINSQIALTFDISQQGLYIIEINHSAGYAVLNRPVYVGRNIIPLIPDSEDLKDTSRSPAVIVSQQPLNIFEQRNLLISLINAKRAEFNLEPVYLDDKLNQVAQQHTQDMIRRNYSSHYSPQGLGPTDRARNNQVFEEVGQNIGMNSDLTDAHYRLCRSNIHLRNIVNPKWVRVGLGVRLNNNNSFVVTQVFSAKDLAKQPLSQADLGKIKAEILDFIINKAKAVRSQNTDLSSKILAWHNTKPGASSSELTGFLRGLMYRNFSGIVLKVPYSSQSVTAIKNAKVLIPLSTIYTQVGMSVKFNNGNLQVYVGYVA